LLAGLRNAEWAQSWSAAYVVAAAAQARGDLATADEMWWRVVTVHGIRTRQSLLRAAVALVLRRDRDDVGAGCTAFVDAAGLLDGVPLGTAADPEVALDAVRLVRERGDHAGAVLLLRALDRCTASHPTIGAELERLLPRRRPRRRAHGVLLLAAALFVAGLSLSALTGAGLLGSCWGAACASPSCCGTRVPASVGSTGWPAPSTGPSAGSSTGSRGRPRAARRRLPARWVLGRGPRLVDPVGRAGGRDRHRPAGDRR
jgi:hypothetical protein